MLDRVALGGVGGWAERLLPLVSVPCCLLLSYLLVRRGVPYALGALALPVAGLWLLSRRGNGYLLAVAVLLVVPYFYAHVWEIAPLAAGVGLLAGTVASKRRIVDFAVLAICVWFTGSWLFHPELGITTKLFVQGMLPFQFYLWTRLTLSRQLLPRLQWLILAAAGLATLTVLLEAARGTVMFADAQRYQWAGDSTDVFRAGGIFGGSPPAGIALAMLILTSAVMLRSTSHRKLIRLILGGMVLAMILTFARSAYLAFGGGVIMMAILLPYRRWGRVALAVFALSIPAFALITSPNTLNYLSATKLVSSGLIRSTSNEYRLSFLGLATPLVADTRPHLLFGRGFEAFEAPGQEDSATASVPILVNRGGPHDDYLRAILEQGLVGLALWLVWLGGSAWLGLRTLRRLPRGSDQRFLVCGLTAAVFGYMLASFFQDLQHNIPDLSMAALMTGILVSVCAFPHPEAAKSLARAHGVAASEDGGSPTGDRVPLKA